MKRRRRKIVRFMAGGWAAGKTHTLEKMRLSTADLTWDGTLGDSNWASEMILIAIMEGWKVEVAYVYRDLEIALFGAVERALKEGRGVPLTELPRSHDRSQKAVLELIRSYSVIDTVSFLLLHNIGFAGHDVMPLKLSYEDLEQNGGLHYTSSHVSYFEKAAREIRAAFQGQGRLAQGIC